MKEEWLSCFSSGNWDTDLSKVIEIYLQSPNHFTVNLIEYINRFAADAILTNWRSQVISHDPDAWE